LDLGHQLKILSLVYRLTKEQAMAVIAATHNVNLASSFSDRVSLLNEGRIYSAGNPESVITCENIKAVYGVHVDTINQRGKPYIVPCTKAAALVNEDRHLRQQLKEFGKK